MNKNINSIISAIFIIFAVSISYSIIVFAQAPEITYPVKELGNCGNEAECKVFCDKPENMAFCVGFAEQKGLMSHEEAKKAKAFVKASMKGPGGCSNKNECESYCNNTNNLGTCLDFAKNNNLMSEDELREAEKVSKALKEGIQLPGGCSNKNECESYCNNTNNLEECIAFAEKSGIIPQNELTEAKKAAKAMQSGIRPPGNCQGKKECEAYCSSPDHMEECFSFAEKAGFIPPEEVEMAKKMMPLMQAGKMPGGCRSKDECQAYCLKEDHNEECSKFALEAGLMKPEEAEMFKKTGGKGPGGCKGKDQCETFCNNPENQEVCFNFAKEHDLIPEEEIKNMKQGMEQMRKGFEMAPPEVAGCLKSNIGEDILDKVQSGQIMPSQQVGEGMKKCFEQFMPQGFQGQGGSIKPEDKFSGKIGLPDGGFLGPGGCKSREECQKYCSENPNECSGFKKENLKGMEDFRSKFPEGAPSEIIQKEMIQKMMQEKNIPQEIQKGEIPQQNIPEQYQKMIEQYQQYPQSQYPGQAPQYPGQIPPGAPAQFPQEMQQMQPMMPMPSPGNYPYQPQ